MYLIRFGWLRLAWLRFSLGWYGLSILSISIAMLNLTLIFYLIYLIWSVVIVKIYWHTTVGTPNFQNGQCMPALVIFSLYGLVLPKCTMMGFILKNDPVIYSHCPNIDSSTFFSSHDFVISRSTCQLIFVPMKY